MFGARYKLLLHVKSTHCKETVKQRRKKHAESWGGGVEVHTYYNKTSEQGHFGENINSAVMSFVERSRRFILKL